MFLNHPQAQAGRTTRPAACGPTTRMTGGRCALRCVVRCCAMMCHAAPRRSLCHASSQPCKMPVILVTVLSAPAPAPPLSSPTRLEKYARARWTDITQTVLKWNGQVMEPAGEHTPVSCNAAAAAHLSLKQLAQTCPRTPSGMQPGTCACACTAAPRGTRCPAAPSP